MWITLALLSSAFTMLLFLTHFQLNKMRKQRQAKLTELIPLLIKRSEKITDLLKFADTKVSDSIQKSLLDHMHETIEQTAKIDDMEDRIGMENQIDVELDDFFALVEEHEELKVSEVIYSIKGQLIDAEIELADYTVPFNILTTEYNEMLFSFPANLFGRILGFRAGEVFAMLKEEDNTEQ